MPAKSDRIKLIVCSIDSDSQEAKRLIDGVLSVNRSKHSRAARPSDRALTATATEEFSLDVCDWRDKRDALYPLLDAPGQLLEALDLSATGNLIVEVVGDRNNGYALRQWNDPRVLKL